MKSHLPNDDASTGFQSRLRRLREHLKEKAESLRATGIELPSAKKPSNPPGFQKFHNAPPFDNRPDYPTFDKRY